MKKMTVWLIIFCLISGSIGFYQTFGSSPGDQVVTVAKKTLANHPYVPVRETFEKLGFQVVWQGETMSVTLSKGTHVVMLRNKETYLLRDGVLVDGKRAPFISLGKMYMSVDMLEQIFKVKPIVSMSSVRVTEGLRVDKGPALVGSKAQYEKLLSFYPLEMPVLYMKDGFDMPVAEATSAPSDEGYTGTNNQVAGVDESDTVKTDGAYLYSIKDQEVLVFQTGRETLKILHRLSQKDFTPTQLFITDKHLIVMGYEQDLQVTPQEKGNRIMIAPRFMRQLLSIQVYDKTDLPQGSPALVKTYSVQGHFVASRLIGQALYVVANDYQYGYYYEEMPLPQWRIQGANQPAQTTTIGFDALKYFPGQVGNAYVYTLGIDLNDLTATGLDVQAYLGRVEHIFASKDALYMVSGQYSGMWWQESQFTQVQKFTLDQGKVTYNTQAEVEGHVLNQFSMDEHEGHFRIATTTQTFDEKGEWTSSNRLEVLDETLKKLGAVDGLAPGERIYSTRMMGDKVFMVTYRQVDPFYVIDVSNPAEPTVLGYLKIPGYSSYLHPYDDQTIIGIGMQTLEVEGRIVNDGVKIALFDVSDYQNPKEKDVKIVGDGSSYTDVSYDHKAFLLSQKHNVMALPIQTGKDWQSSSKDAYVFSFDGAGKLIFEGLVTHHQPNASNTMDPYSLGITRIMIIGGDLYTLSPHALMISDLNNLQTIKLLAY